MNGYRKYMIESDGNLGWCKALDFGDVQISVNEGIINGIMDSGVDIDSDEGILSSNFYTEKTLTAIAKKVNPNYDLYDGYNATHIILDAKHDELPCKLCPWFNVCSAMDNPEDWEEYNTDYPDDN